MKLFVPCAAIVVSVFATGYVGARDLTFEDRVAAEKAIEQVYYSHQLGATMTFEDAVPRAVLEAKVHTYLDETVALKAYWKTAVTDEMLQRELERMAQGTRMPERLLELYAALGNDPFLVKECLARPALVDRLAHNFYAFDPTLHARTRAQAESLHSQVAAGELSASAVHPNRTVSELIARADAAVSPPTEQPLEKRLTPEEFKKRRSELPAGAGQASAIAETRDEFVFQVVLSETATELRVAAYVVPKITWDAWWSDTRGATPHNGVQEVAIGGGDLPMPRSSRPGGSSDPCPDDYWDNSSSDSLSLRTGHTAVWTGNLMLIWGGLTDGAYSNTGARYDPSTDSWTPTSVIGAPSPRGSHTAVWTGSSMIIWGGGVDTGGRYDAATNTWMPTSAVNAPSARSGHSAVWTGSSMLIWGGSGSGVGVLNSGGRYDPASDVWVPTSTVNAPSAREFHTAVWTGNAMVVWGGSTGGSNGSSFNTGGRYDPVNDTWAPTTTAGAPSGRYFHSAVWTGNVMVVWGGYTFDVINHFQYFNTGGRYNPVTDSWTPTAVAGAPSARYAHTGVWTGSSMLIWGGSSCCSSFNTGGRYDPVSDNWRPTATLGAAIARWNHSAVWTGSLMVVWGGSGMPPEQNPKGGRYEPVTDSWTPMAGSTAPSPRSAHTAVWTGSLMVVWGGSYNGDTNTGGRYDPATDSWSPTNIAEAPYGRWAHVAVWTGSLMLVWGGGNFDTYWDAGGRYDPVADHWLPISSVGAPPKTGWGTAVWTGTRMVVWGGSTQQGYAGGTGRYDPYSDHWSPMSYAGAPSRRSDTSAVWTGSRMVVWGGYATDDGTTYVEVNSGGRYDPIADTWAPTSTVGAPSPRRAHAAVWMGNSMFVWGGYASLGDYQEFNTGGRYDPVTNTWTPTSLVGAPAAITSGKAVWTGSRALVWGGSGGGPDQTSGIGGRYDPATDGWMPITSVDAPVARSAFTSVWAGSMMLIWGGSNGSTGGRYLSGGSNDNDGDGYTRCQGDCNDQNAAVHPGAPETCNGLDDNCDGTVDNGADALCNDHNACTADSCNGAAGCVSTFCNDGNPCTNDTCDAVLGCVFTNNTNACSDGNACTMGDICQGGTCLPGAGSPNCNDDNVCTTDFCSPAIGCVSTNNTNACDDGIACTVGDTCGNGSCTGTAIVCNDNNACTDDSCNPATGVCSYVNDDTNTCSDGNPCTQTDACHGGICSGSNPVQCNGGCPPGFNQVGGLCQRTYDIDVSLLDNLSNSCDGTGTNRYNGCGYLRYGFHWTDLGSGLGAVTRVDLQLEPGINCGSASSSFTLNGLPAGSFNHVGSCVCSSAHSTMALPNLAVGAYVRAGVNAISITPTGDCEGLSKSVNLSNNFARVTVTYAPHNNACQAGTCDPSAAACVYSNLPDGTTCSDDGACASGGSCAGGSCIGGSPIDCDDGNACTDDSCAPALGCQHVPTQDTDPCDDGNACTILDVCNAGACSGQTIVCNDFNPCTDDSCDPGVGCVFAANTAACDDDNICTSADVCRNGSCQGTPVDGGTCSDHNVCTTSGVCQNGTCVGSLPLQCSDGNLCNGTETCNPAIGCVAGTPLNCDDGNACTSDSCNPSAGCVHANNANACNDGNPCTTGDSCGGGVCHAGVPANCDDGNPCTDDSCNASTGCRHINNTNVCNDGNVCTTAGRCVGGVCSGGGGINCDDGNACTDDICNSVNGCQHVNNTDACDDGNLCTLNDACAGGTCHSGPLVVCNDFNPCTTDTCFPDMGCVSSANAAPCDDGNACTVGDTCGEGYCQSGTVIIAPPETQNMMMAADKVTTAWSSATGATRYDVVRGSTGSFPVGPGGGDEVCFDNLLGPTLTDATLPTAGTGFWYLSRGENACGIGTFGTRHDGTPRTTTTCP